MKEAWERNKHLLLFIVLLLTFRSAVADWNRVPTGSMKPTIVEGDYIIVDKLAYDVRVPFTSMSLQRLDDPARGDVVVFDSEATGTRLVKRVIGIPGDMVELKWNRLYVNGVAADYAPLAAPAGAALETLGANTRRIRTDAARPSPRRSFGPVQVPPGHYFVLGDNRDDSADSRYIGFVPRGEIVGRSGKVLASFDPDAYYRPRWERVWEPLERPAE